MTWAARTGDMSGMEQSEEAQDEGGDDAEE